jgi:hypothetical protein
MSNWVIFACVHVLLLALAIEIKKKLLLLQHMKCWAAYYYVKNSTEFIARESAHVIFIYAMQKFCIIWVTNIPVENDSCTPYRHVYVPSQAS